MAAPVLDTTTASGATNALRITQDLGLEMEITVAASVTVQATNHDAAPTSQSGVNWVSLGIFTTSNLFTLPPQFRFYRLVWTGNTGTIRVRDNT